jgi:acyl CoA:acetate/3-ketoacid CoA transferase beta subunit
MDADLISAGETNRHHFARNTNDSAFSLRMIRGQHVDLASSAMEVAENRRCQLENPW